VKTESNMVYVGIDPSFSSTGIAMYCSGSDQLFIDKRSQPVKGLSFMDFVVCVDVQTNSIKEVVFSPRYVKNKNTHVLIEYPPPVAQWSAGLYALDTVLVLKLRKGGCHVKGVPPNKIQSLFGKRKVLNSESVELAKELMALNPVSWISFRGDIIENKVPRIKVDEAEALIFMYLLMYTSGEIVHLPEYLNKDKWVI